MNKSAVLMAQLEAASAIVPEIDVHELNHLISETEQHFYLLDVREDYEWDQGHIFGAIHLGRGILESMMEDFIPDTSADIITYCRSGYRSLLAAKTLKDLGYTNVKSLKGGFTAWCEAGLEADGELMTCEEQQAILRSQHAEKSFE